MTLTPRFYLRRLRPEYKFTRWAEDTPTYVMVWRRTRAFNLVYRVHSTPYRPPVLPIRKTCTFERITARESRQAVGPRRFWMQLVEDFLGFRFPSLVKEEREQRMDLFLAHCQPPTVSFNG